MEWNAAIYDEFMMKINDNKDIQGRWYALSCIDTIVAILGLEN